jgi:hypothetical protein
MDYTLWIIAVLIVLILFTNNPLMDKLDEYCKDYSDHGE